MIGRLGLEQFGVWAITGAVAQYAAVLDLGISRSLARFVAVHHGDGTTRVKQTICFGLLAVTFLTGIMLAAALGLGPFLGKALDVPLNRTEFQLVLVSSVTIAGASLYQRVLAAYPTGTEDMVTPNVAGALVLTLSAVASIGALIASGSLAVYAAANSVAAIAGTFITLAVVRARCGNVGLALPTKQYAMTVMRFSAKGQIPWIADLINYQTDKIVLAAAVDLRAAAAYEVVSRVANAVRQVANTASSALLPTAARRIRDGGRDMIVPLAARYGRIGMTIAAPLYGTVLVAGPCIVLAWIGQRPPDSALILAGLLIAYTMNGLGAVPSILAIVDDAQRIMVVPAVGTAVANVVLTLTLAPLLGTVGIIGGTVVALSGGAIGGLLMFARHYGTPVRALMMQLAAPVAPVAMICAAVAVPAGLAGAWTDPNRLHAVAWAVAIAAGIVAGNTVWWACTRPRVKA